MLALHFEPFDPVLLNSDPVTISQEQDEVIHLILQLSCSDSRFAEKAYRAIKQALITPHPMPTPEPEPEPTTKSTYGHAGKVRK